MAVGYCRRSTDRQEQSIPDQQKVIERYCVDNGLRLLSWYIDDAISGTSSSNRPGFQRMIADAKAARSFSTIVAYDIKRFGRVDNDEAGYYRHVLRSCGVEVAYAAEGFLGGETDDLLRPVKQWQARQESKDLSKVTIRGLLSKVEGGWWMGGVPPHGYDLRYTSEAGELLFVLRHMPDGSKLVLDQHGHPVRTLARGESLSISKRDRAKLVPGEPARVEAVRRIFAMYTVEGNGLKAIADGLNRAGVLTPRNAGWGHIYAGKEVGGARGWRDSSIRAILVNPLYAGDMVWNRRTDARFHMIAGGAGQCRAVERGHAHGARLVPNDPADWITVRDTHEGLVSRKTWERARAIRLARPVSAGQVGVPKAAVVGGPTGGWTGARSRFILSGLLYCGRCGHRYQGVTRQKGTPRRDGTKVKTCSYACGGYIAKGTSACTFGPVGQEVLENAVIQAVLEFYKRYEGVQGRELLVRAVREAVGVEAEDLGQARKRLETDRQRVQTSIANLLDNITAGTRNLAERRLAELRLEHTRLEARAGELERLAEEEGRVQETVHELARFIASLEFTLRHGVGVEKMTALRRCVVSARVERGDGRAVVSVRWVPGVSSYTAVTTAEIDVVIH